MSEQIIHLTNKRNIDGMNENEDTRLHCPLCGSVAYCDETKFRILSSHVKNLERINEMLMKALTDIEMNRPQINYVLLI